MLKRPLLNKEMFNIKRSQMNVQSAQVESE